MPPEFSFKEAFKKDVGVKTKNEVIWLTLF